MTYGMLIDLRRCVGCHACSVSCKGANATRPGVLRSYVVREFEGSYPDVRSTYIPKLCNHCDTAACVDACPTGATEKREDGVVTIDKEKCIGCQACINACPYEVRYLIESELGYFGETLNEFESVGYAGTPKGVVDKCDFCSSRAAEGEAPQPACVAACPADARIFGEISELRATIGDREEYAIPVEEDLGPNVIYLADFKL